MTKNAISFTCFFQQPDIDNIRKYNTAGLVDHMASHHPGMAYDIVERECTVWPGKRWARKAFYLLAIPIKVPTLF